MSFTELKKTFIERTKEWGGGDDEDSKNGSTNYFGILFYNSKPSLITVPFFTTTMPSFTVYRLWSSSLRCAPPIIFTLLPIRQSLSTITFLNDNDPQYQ